MSVDLHRRALALSYLTVGYNLLEGLVAVAAGAWAGSIALVGFGLDSFVESLSGMVMIWRFRPHARLSPLEVERREQRAVKLVGLTFFILAAYVLYESAGKLWFQEPPEPTLLGIAIALISLMAMPLLYYLKDRTGRQLGSVSLMADARQTLACAFLSAALLLGLGANYLFGFWQADPAIGLLIGVVLVKEGVEAWRQGKLCACGAISCGKE
ncbi:MAG: cation transporter [Syntrophobacterales bacterium]|nr:cation transporter [Syntrophobacterales bacterium]